MGSNLIYQPLLAFFAPTDVLNKTRVVNRHILVETLDSRPCHVPVITVANHSSCFDDPGLWSKYYSSDIYHNFMTITVFARFAPSPSPV